MTDWGRHPTNARQMGLRNGEVPVSDYVSPAYFERERERIFRRVWLMVGRVEEVQGVECSPQLAMC
jgi:hypothetical protein